MPHVLRPFVLLPLVALVGVGGTLAAQPGGSVEMSTPGAAALGARAVRDAVVTVATHGRNTAILVDGTVVARGSSGTVRAPLAALGNGRHVVVAEVERGLLRGTARRTQAITVDTTAPALLLTVPPGRVTQRSAVSVSGTAEPGSRLSVHGGTLRQQGSHFTIAYARPPAAATVTATDPAGNSTVRQVSVPTSYPAGVRGVHVTGRAWSYAPLREPVLALLRQHRINAVQLDIKDEDGVVNYASTVPMARTVGAASSLYDARQATRQLHALGARVVGRIVAFNDPKLADWAMAHAHRDWVIQTPDGGMYRYGYNKHGFSNFAAQPVRDYNRDLAVEAVQLGFDDVVFDYVRRPDGPIGQLRFPGLKGDPADSIAGFLGEVQPKVRALGGSLGAAAFAQAATRPFSTAQDIPKMARHLDLVIPMDYPSHWNNGEYGVPNVYAGAKDIVQRSLIDWQKAVKGTGCVVVPWLQDEDFRGTYDAAKVRQQIAGARQDGLPGWLMWSAGATYTGAAYSPDAAPVR